MATIFLVKRTKKKEKEGREGREGQVLIPINTNFLWLIRNAVVVIA